LDHFHRDFKRNFQEDPLLLLLKSSIGVLIFAVGMTATGDDILHLWRRPVLLVKSVIAMYLVMPIAAAVMTRLFDLPAGTELALVILAICAGAPLLPKKLIKFGGNPSFVFSLIVTTSLLAIVTVPASLQILAANITFDTTGVTPAHVARVILKTFLLPLAFGMLFRLMAPTLANKYSDYLLKVAGIVMALCAITLLVFGLPRVIDLGLPSLLVFALFTIIAILAGHLLGGPEPSNRSALAVACASRHIGLALLTHRRQRPRQEHPCAGGGLPFGIGCGFNGIHPVAQTAAGRRKCLAPRSDLP
jgi:BASS family bile acid:Na+ symporter